MLLAPMYTLSIAENVFGSFVEWVTNMVTDLFDGVTLAFCNLTMPDMTAFSQSFPFLVTAFEAIKYFALALLFLIVVFQLFKAFGGKIVEAEDPTVLIIRAMLFGTLIYFAQPIFDTLLKIAMVPYEIFDGQHGFLTEAVTPGQFSDLTGVNGFGAFFTVTGLFSGVGPIIILLLSLVLFWNYIKLLIEVVERYVVVGVLYYTSPLAFALGASKTTTDVFKNWCRMVGSELFIIVMNVWFLRGFSSALGYFTATLGGAEYGNDSNALVRMLVGYFSLLAYLRVASKFDEYLGQLGLNAAKTGGGPLGSIGAVMALKPIMRALTGGGSLFGGGKAGAGAGAASKVLGAGGGIAGIPNKAAAAFKPETYVGNAIGGKKQGFGGLVGAVANTAGRAYASTHGLGDVGQISRLANSANSSLNSIAGKAGLNDAQMFMPGVFGKSGLNYNSGAQMNSPGKMSGEFSDANGNKFGLVATSMKANDAPEGAFGVAKAADGSGFYVQALDKNGKVSEDGMAAVFGAPTIGDAEGQTPANAFGNSFFPHQENTTNDLAFENDANDPFTLHATDTDGNEFTYRSGAAYDSDGIDTADAMVLTDANGQTWFAEDGSALNTEGLGDGVTVGSDGSVVDANGNIVSDNVANALGSTDVADVSEASMVGATVEGDTADIEMASAPAIASDGGTVDIDSVDVGGADVGVVGAAVEGDTADIDIASAPAIVSDGGAVDVGGTNVNDTPIEDTSSIGANTAVGDNNVDFSGSQSADINIPENDSVESVAGEREFATVGAPDDAETGSVDTAYDTKTGNVDAVQNTVDGNNVSDVYGNASENTPNSIEGENGSSYNKNVDGVNNTENSYNNGVNDVNNPDNAYDTNHGGGVASGYATPMSENDIAQKEAIENNNNAVAGFFGLDANKIQYADTSKKDEGIVTVHNKDGSSSMFVADKGSHEVSGPSDSVKSSNNQTWREVKGTRGVEQRYTGKRDENGKPITQDMPTVKYDANVIPKQNNGPQKKFSSKKPQKPATQTKKTNTRGGSNKKNGGSKGGKKGGKR